MDLTVIFLLAMLPSAWHLGQLMEPNIITYYRDYLLKFNYPVISDPPADLVFPDLEELFNSHGKGDYSRAPQPKTSTIVPAHFF